MDSALGIAIRIASVALLLVGFVGGVSASTPQAQTREPQSAHGITRGRPIPDPVSSIMGEPGPSGPIRRPPTKEEAAARRRVDRSYSWEWWWSLNQDRFLKLKTRVRSTWSSDSDFGDEVQPGERHSLHLRIIQRYTIPYLKVAAKSSDCDVRCGALIALGKTGLPGYTDVADFIKGHSGDLEHRVRESACLALGILGDRDQIPFLLGIANNDEHARVALGRGNANILTRTRAFAAVAVGLMAQRGDLIEPKYAASLLKLVKTGIWHANDTAEPSPTFHRDAYERSDVAAAAALALGYFRTKETVTNLLAQFKDKNIDNRVRAQIGVSLGRIGDALASSGLLKSLSARSHVSQAAALALGRITPSTDRRALKKLTLYGRGSACRGTRNFATIALAQAGGMEGVPLLLALLSGKNHHQRAYAALGLGISAFTSKERATKEVGKHLLKALGNAQDDTERGAHVIALGLSKHAPAGPRILKLLTQTKSSHLKGHCCTSLGLLSHGEAVPAIRSVLTQCEDPDLFMKCTVALSLLGDRSILETLHSLVNKPNTSSPVRGAAILSLGHVGDIQSLRTLCSLLDDAYSGGHQVTNVMRAHIVVSFGLLGDKDALPTLSKLRSDSNYLSQTPVFSEILRIR